jgi:hypothetical protein
MEASMKRLILESWLLLLYLDWVMHWQEFEDLHQMVRHAKCQPAATAQLQAVSELCHAMDYACVFYVKRVLCLQRSAATTILLRRYGWSAEMVIGAQILPFKSHAWCEIKGEVVNDKPYMKDIYQVLERC